MTSVLMVCTGNTLAVGALSYLRSFDPRCAPTTLDDPWGNPVSAYERMYDEIEASIPGLLAHLARLAG